jgi:galactonate dehydratase
VRLHSSDGKTGIGEASDAFGFANTTAADVTLMQLELSRLFEFVRDRSPLEIERYRQEARWFAAAGLVQATAYSAIEQALWDLSGKIVELPVHALLGGKVRGSLPVYANINRATNPRTPEGFAASAVRAVGDGFRALKAAPFDGFPAPGSSAAAINHAVDSGIRSMEAMREAVGPEVAIMVDCHSFFDVALATEVARRLEPVGLAWYEEPVPPTNVDDTVAIRERIAQPMAGGEVLFGLEGFEPLVRRKAFDVIMPDVKHCGGLRELTHIAAMAAASDISVAPHNPSGPVSTAASVHVCAVLAKFNYIELQYGEVDWRGQILSPAEEFVDGAIRVPDTPGFGIELDDAVVASRGLPV